MPMRLFDRLPASSVVRRRVPVRRETFAGEFVSERWHLVNARRVDPEIVEPEQRDDRDRVVDGFVRPPHRADGVDVLTRDRVCLSVRFVE